MEIMINVEKALHSVLIIIGFNRVLKIWQPKTKNHKMDFLNQYSWTNHVMSVRLL